MTVSCHTAAPLTIAFADAELDDLHRRLDRTRWPEALSDSSWQHGVALDHVRDLARYWRSNYDWRACEAELNALAHFVTVIDGQTLHFLHVRSAVSDAYPLMLIHGWPGSFAELLDVVKPLSDPDGGQAFHLVVPSLPGFGFSAPLRDGGWTPMRIAGVFAELMRRLGYERFGVQGGDWGAVIAADMGRLAPERVAGVHVNAATVGFVPSDARPPADLDHDDQVRLERLAEFRTEGSAFFQLQATRPQTLAYALTDSPVGLLAWMGEKFYEWSHKPGRIDRDRLLTNVTLHWLTRTANSAARIYFEARHAEVDLTSSGVPTGVAVFAEDLAIRASAEQHNEIVRWSEFDRGGHFAALEEPELLVEDVRAFFAERSFA